MTEAAVKSRAPSAVLTLTGILFVALNLRPALTSVSPVLKRIGETLALGSFGQGILTTLPVLFLGLCAPLAPRLAQRIGVDRAVLVATAVLGAVLVLRPYSGTVGLFAGTLIAGGCIGVMGVLLPGVVKRDFPSSASILTGFYTAVLCLGASAAAGTTEPMRLAFGGDWQAALAIWTIPAWVAVVLWWLQLDGKHIPKRPTKPARSLFRDPLAWQVTLYMGLQSSLAYSVFGWLPTILQDRGMSAVNAGIGLSVSIMIQIGSAIAAPWISSRMRDQRAMIALAVLFTGAGLMGCIYAPIGGIWFWAVILGVGQGGTFSMALTLLAVRARDHETAARLSGMAQGVGYTMAAVGPLVLGLLHGAFDDWQVAGVFLAVIALAALGFGLAAGRPLYVGEER
ncbi:MFS transporter [Marinobacter sp. R17]|uniref:CynX/NimT family MFS transporter n=1 Tax=Marinobacter sp. R17 TaxID=2484250 RepID=UPI000F4B60DA|nr:MFS transporter [Marinobacter sp. R17]ROT96346.1 MFS transporter [Marinobacter sp. R17]